MSTSSLKDEETLEKVEEASQKAFPLSIGTLNLSVYLLDVVPRSA